MKYEEKSAKFDLIVHDAVCFKLKDSGAVEDYALRWLHLTNNTREYPSMIYKIWNTPDYVYVLSTRGAHKTVHRYLQYLGYEIIEKSDEQVIMPVFACDDDDKWLDVIDFIEFRYVLEPEWF